MKKIYSLILSAMMLIPAFAVAQSVDYCAPTGVDGRSSGENQTSATGRCLTVINVTDGTNSVAVQGAPAPTGGSRAIVYDRTSTVLSTSAGKTITMKSVGEGSWMNTFVYIDWGLDGLTTADRVFSNFNANVGMPYGDVTVTTNVPAGQAPGDYRVRYIIDWENTDPCHYGQASEGWSKPNDNGEYVIDFTIRIESEDYDTARTITVASANAAHGSVAITNPATDGNSISTTQKAVTIVATPAEGYSFLNWTDAAGNVVSTDASYTYTGAEDASFTAHFGFALTYSVGTNGSATFSVGTEMLASGAVVAPGTEVVMTANPDTNKFTTMTINGESVSVVGNTHTFVVEEATDVVVNFVDAIYTMTINIIGDGEVKITDNGTHKTGPTGNEYVSGSEITGKALRGFFKPAEGAQLVYVGYIDEGLAEEDKTENLRAVEAAGYEGWYYVPLNRPSGNRVLTVKFTEVSAIGEIGVDPANGPVEYYNLQGVRVAAENLIPGFYVVRQGDKVAKVFINK